MSRDNPHIGSSFESWLEAEGIAEEVTMAVGWAAAHSLIGTWRRFGPFGPVYEIIAVSESQAKGGLLMRIRVNETREELTYPLTRILNDPKAV